jgi:hypothetical protein
MLLTVLTVFPEMHWRTKRIGKFNIFKALKSFNFIKLTMGEFMLSQEALRIIEEVSSSPEQLQNNFGIADECGSSSMYSELIIAHISELNIQLLMKRRRGRVRQSGQHLPMRTGKSTNSDRCHSSGPHRQ